jgi:hypothetical protein
MNDAKCVSAAVLVLAVGGGLVSLQQAEAIPGIGRPARYLGAAFLVVGFGVLSYVSLGYAGKSAKATAKIVVRHTKRLSVRVWSDKSYYKELTKTEDLEDLFKYYVSLFGQDIIPRRDFEQWMRRNPSISWNVVEVRSNDVHEQRRIVGFFDLEPLNVAAVERLERGERNNSSLELKDILPSRFNDSINAYYIGSVGAIEAGVAVKFAVMAQLLSFIEEEAAVRPFTLYTRPVTDIGLKLVKEFGFQPLGTTPKCIWKRHVEIGTKFPSYRDILRRINTRSDQT